MRGSMLDAPGKELQACGRQSMKVLIISHNPISTQSNMGKTFRSLFHQFDREELCQLYIYPVVPNEDRCASYYRVTDKDVLKALIRFQKPGGEMLAERISADHGLYEVPEDQALYKSRKNKTALRRLLRDIAWKLAPWYNSSLKAWLEREKPECIFVAPGVAKFLYDIALRIAKERNIPIVTYICDEYYFVKKPKQWLDVLRLKLLQRKMEKLFNHTRHLVVISEELRQAYAKRFGVDTTVIMTGAAIDVAGVGKTCDQPRNVCYFGNIRCNRYTTLAQIGQALDKMNRVYGEDYRLKIYTAEKDPEILQVFDGINSVERCGFVSGEAFDRAFREADVLVHTEAFDDASIDFTQHSVSTKIADSLASGIPLIAYGPEQISSMAHLLRHQCAVTAVSQDGLQAMLEKALRDKSARDDVVKRALSVAAECHDMNHNSDRFRCVIEETVKADI